MQDLSSIKMENGLLYETIITTKNSDGTPNAAPVGVVCKNGSKIILYLSEAIHTLQNIKNSGHFIVNILKDPIIFTKSIVGDLSQDCFKNHLNDFYITNADAFFSATVIKSKEIEKGHKIGNSKLTIITAEVNEIIIKNKNVEPLNRANFAIIESLIYLCRMNIVDNKTAQMYLERINEMSRLVTRVGNKEHKKAMKKIISRL